MWYAICNFSCFCRNFSGDNLGQVEAFDVDDVAKKRKT